MRPRSRLLSKRGLLLPTIREGSEETLRDLNETNALRHAPPAHRGPPSVSSEDYLLSICHLAHPTFPAKDGHPAHVQARHHHHHHHHRRLRLGGAAAEDGKLDNRGVFGGSDPLEFLYGQQSGLSGVSPGVREALLEGRFLGRGAPTWEAPGAYGQRQSAGPDSPHAEDGAPRPALEAHGGGRRRRRSGAGAAAAAAHGEAAEAGSPSAGIKQSLISQWISDCRSAWREARVRACVLPAIAEI